MSKYLVYDNSSAPVTGNPVTAQEYYNYMSGSWRNNVPWTFGGNGYNSGSTDYTSFIYPDKSDSAYYSTFGQWNEATVGNPPGDRRFIVSSGPFTFYPDQCVCITYAVIWSRAASGTNIASRDSLL